MRKANNRWLQEAPAGVYDCFDLGEKWTDRYMVIAGPTIEWDGKSWASVLNSNESMSFSGWSEMTTDDIRSLRYKFGHRRTTWLSLPEKIREAVMTDVTDMQVVAN